MSLRLKKPLKGMTLTVTFNGIAEVDKYLVTFLSISHDIYVGGEPFLVQRYTYNDTYRDVRRNKLTEDDRRHQ